MDPPAATGLRREVPVFERPRRERPPLRQHDHPVPVQNYDTLVVQASHDKWRRSRHRRFNSNEVTEQHIDLESRLRNLERTEQQYLELLAKAANIQEILTVQDRLSSVRSQIEQILGRLKVLDNQTDFATVNLSIAPLLAKVETPKDNNWTMSGVWSRAGSVRSKQRATNAAAGIVILGCGNRLAGSPSVLG